MKLKLALLIGLMFSAPQASERAGISDDESAKDFFNPSDDEGTERADSPLDFPLLTELTREGEKEEGESLDDEQLPAAIKASLEFAARVKAFQEEADKVAASPKSTIGKVAFEVVMRNALNVMSSRDPIKLQRAIDKVKDIQRNNILTEDQSGRVDKMLVDLACALSVITNHENLGAR